MRHATLFASFLSACTVLGSAPAPAHAQDCSDLYNPKQVLTFNITMPAQDWDTLRNSCPDGYCGEPPHEYFPAFLACGDSGLLFVGIRRKNGPAVPSEADPQKVALKIDVDEFISGQTFFGKKKLSLENGSEGTLVTEGLSWQIYQTAGVVACRSAWANVYVNGDYKGLYINVEQVNKRFLTDHGIDNDGFLFKVEGQRTRELETSPFAFNWYPFDHPNQPPEQPAPPDWRTQTSWRVDMSNLLRLAVAENFTANTDGGVQRMTNYWYYDWSILVGDNPAGQQPRLYLAWDLDTTMRDSQTEMPITDSGPGHLQHGLIDELQESGVRFAEPTFQEDYLRIYWNLLNGPLALSELGALVDQIESVISSHMDADPYQQTGPAATEFERLRAFLEARTASVQDQLSSSGLGDHAGDGDVDLEDFAAFAVCHTGDAPPECADVQCGNTFDFDEDCDVDVADFRLFHPLLGEPKE